MAGDTGRTALLRPEWEYVAPTRLDDFRAADWALLARQRRVFDAEQQAEHALRLLRATAADPGFGYQINNFRHSLQAATAAMQDGRDEEYIVVTLFHDVGFTICPGTHGAFAAAMLAPYIGDAGRFVLEHHQMFQAHHCHEHPDEAVDPAARDAWRGHPHFAATAEFVARYDVTTITPGLPEAPLDAFAPMLRRLLARPPRPMPPRAA
jgi:predicted HD phosphohydrolase